MKYVLAIAFVGCAGNGDSPEPPAPPAPWHSGSLVRALLYRSDDLVAFAGRYNTMVDFSCRYDAVSATFVDCPRHVEALYRNIDCTQRDLVAGDGFTTYAVADLIGKTSYLARTGTIEAPAYRADDFGTCTVLAGTGTWAVVEETDAQDLALGTEQSHEYNGVTYRAIETDDGFSVITQIDPPTESQLDATTGRLRGRYEARGPIRRYAGLFDSSLDVPCYPSDGYCLPQETSAWPMVPNGTCAHEPATIIGDKKGITRRGDTLYLCDQPVTGTWSYIAGGGVCMVVTSSRFACSPRALADFAPLAVDLE